MTIDDLTALMPLIVLAAGTVLLLIIAAFRRSDSLALMITVVVLGLSFAALFLRAGNVQVTPLLVMDGYARFFMGLMFAASAAIALIASRYLKVNDTPGSEFYILLLLATLGSAALVASSHFASFFLGLEILSISLYSLVAYERTRERSVEAGIKYLVLAGASSAFLLFGMALVYAETGTMELARLGTLPSVAGTDSRILLLPGIAMMIVGIGFKLALVPFHLWTPDVYEGAPAPATAFVASVSKGAVFALLLRFFSRIDMHAYPSLLLVFVVLAVLSMLGGNLLALLQTNVKRILAYSSIAHLGYLLVAFLASGPLAVSAIAFYLVSYFITTVGAFGVVTVLSGKDRDADNLQDYRGLVRSHPWLAVMLTAMLLSLAGIPLTAGFVGKFLLVAAGVGSALWLLVVVLVVSSAIGLFYYLRIIVAIYASPDAEKGQVLAPSLSAVGGAVLAVLTLLLVWLGVYPVPLIQFIEAFAGRFI